MGRKLRSSLIAAVFLSVIFLAPAPAPAQDTSLTAQFIPPKRQSQFLAGRLTEYHPGQREVRPGQVVVTVDADPPIVIRADEIESDRNVQLNHFLGNVSITRGEETVTADRAVWNDATNTAEVSGNIRIDTPEFTVMAERAVINLDLHMAKIYEGKAFFPAQNYYLSGALIERLGEKVIHIENGSATTCDGPNPAWTIEADSLTVTEGGYATAKGVSFNTRYAPIFTAPYFMFPVKNERQSGLLFPGISSSSRDGFTVALPFFWATGENHDLTYTPVWRNDRGLSNTLEGRYHFTHGRGTWQFTHLDDRKTQTYDYKNSDKSERTNDRYWLRAQNQWNYNEWDINFNLDLVSDPLYLAEFRNDFDGFYKSQDVFAKDFGYTVNEYLDPLRVNTLFAQRTDYDTFFRGGIEYTVDLYSDNNRDTIQKLPSLQYNLVSRPLPETLGGGVLANLPRFSMDTRYDYFTRTSNQNSWTDETGHRMFVNPSLTWSSPVSGLATLQLDGDLEMTMYSVDGRRPAASNSAADLSAARHDNYDSRLAGAMTAALSTTFSRVFDGGVGDSLATRHQMTPTVSFTYVGAPDDQSDLPYWDYLDRRLPRRTVRYGLLNTFVSKTATVDKDGQKDGGYNYFQFLKVGLWSSYEFTDNLEWATEPEARYYTTDYFDKGAGPVEVEVETFLNPYFSARLLTGLDGRTGKVTSHDLSFRAADPRGDSLTLTYDFDSPSNALGTGDYKDYEELRADLTMVLNSEWSADFSTRYDIRVGRAMETHARLLYRAQCYGLGVLYSDTDNDRRVGLVVDLLGLGSINYNRSGLASPPQFFYQ